MRMRIKNIIVVSVPFFQISLCTQHHGFWNNQDLIDRKLNAKNVRISDATYEAQATKIAHQETNGDLERYKDKRGSFSKTLSHKSDGMVCHKSFKSMIHALTSGKSKEFDKIILGGTAHLIDPQAAYACARYVRTPALPFAAAGP